MTKILIADDERVVRELLVAILFDAGYDVIEAKDGGAASRSVRAERPDLMILDVRMPVMDGFAVLRELRADPDTVDLPVIMLSGHPAIEGQLAAWELGVQHYLTKPFTPDHVVLAVKVTLRDAEVGVQDAFEGSDSLEWRGSSTVAKATGPADSQRFIRTGSRQLNSILGGGLQTGTLTLIEGTPSAGKSVLCHHITYESLLDGNKAALFASDNTLNGITARMDSIGLDASDYITAGKFVVSPIAEPELDEDPEKLLEQLARQLGDLPGQHEIVIVDSITNLAGFSEDRSVLRFFSVCKRLCAAGKTMVLVSQSHAFDDKMLNRLRYLCDGHFNIRVETIGTRQSSVLEVLKANNAEMSQVDPIIRTAVRLK